MIETIRRATQRLRYLPAVSILLVANSSDLDSLDLLYPSNWKPGESSFRWTFLVLVCFLALTLEPAGAQNFPYTSSHLQKLQGRTVTASCTVDIRAPQVQAVEWVIYANVPPNLPGQRERAAFLTAEGNGQKGELAHEKNMNRPILRLRVPASELNLKSAIRAQCNYSLVLFPRRLQAGRGTNPDGAMTNSERSLYTAPTGVMDYQSTSFQDWLTQHKLRRGTNEGDMAFAWRTFNTIRQVYSYRYISTQNRHVSALSPICETDCGGLSLMYAATLRANQVPARVLFGRWAKSGSKQTDLDDSLHVKSEFYANDVGWIPVEMSGAVSNKSAAPLLYFGHDDGEFITLHVDTDLLFDSIWFGDKDIQFMQQPVFWVTGRGPMDGCEVLSAWQVTDR